MMRRITAPLALLIAVAGMLGIASPAHAFPSGQCIYSSQRPGWHGDSTINGVGVHLLEACQWLDRGNSWWFGRNGNTRLYLKTDGNLVITRNGRQVWQTGTAGSGATQLLFQNDGNLVLYTAGYRRAVWATNTHSRCNYPQLSLQDDSNLVLYCIDTTRVPMWASNTNV
jgi:hypothetical protein